MKKVSKLVYLFELDSVRTTKKEIIAGQKALFDEIVINGNVVVLTYNQLVDNIGFFSLYKNETYRSGLIEFFERGCIRVSQYGDVRTVAQYLINKLDVEEEFVYSALPLNYRQRRLTALLRRSLIYSDLSEINEYIGLEDKLENFEAREKLRDLFIEIDKGELIESKENLEEEKLKEQIKILKNLQFMIDTVLKISTIQQIYISPREPSEYQRLKMIDYLDAVNNFEHTGKSNEFGKAVNLLSELNVDKKNDRSSYYKELQKKECDPSIYYHAKAIVDLCYNYACESSICNISKHYDVKEFLNQSTQGGTFEHDFISRLEKYWRDVEAREDKSVQRNNGIIEFEKKDGIPDMKKGVRLIRYDSVIVEEGQNIPQYENELTKQRFVHKCRKCGVIVVNFFLALVYLSIAFSVQIALDFFQSSLDGIIPWVKVFRFMVILIGVEFLSNLLAKLVAYVAKRMRKTWKLPSFSDSLQELVELLKDFWFVIWKNASTHYIEGVLTTSSEICNNSHPILHVETKEIKKYKRWFIEKSDEYRSERTGYLADVQQERIIDEMIRNEELYGVRYGIIYASKYNQLIVDPVVGKNNNILPYERIEPRGGDGVVIIPKLGDKFVLLKQFRHAIYQEQYSFPRGFSDKDGKPEDNALRELKEEIGTKLVYNVEELGKIAPDSGLSSNHVHVFLCEIADYNLKKNYEGIREIVLFTKDEIKDMIGKKQIDDGFSLGAFLLYENVIYK